MLSKNVDGRIVVGTNQSESLKIIDEDLKKILSQINDLEVNIGHAKLSKTAMDNLQQQIEAIKATINVSTIKINQDQAVTEAQQTGQQLGKAIYSNAEKEQDAYEIAYNALKKLYDLKIEYAQLAPSTDADFYYENAIAKQKEIFKQARANTSTPENWDVQKRLELKREELVMQAKLQKAYEDTSVSQKKIDEIHQSIDNGHGASRYQNQITGLINELQRYGITVEDAKAQTNSLQRMFDNMKGLSGHELVEQADKFEQEFKAVETSIDKARLAYDKYAQPVSGEKISSLIIRIQRYLEKNTNITKEAQLQLSDYVQELNGGNISLARWNAINATLKDTEDSISLLGKLGEFLSSQLKEIGQSISSYFSVSSLFEAMFPEQEAVSELKEINGILTEISKNSDLTDKQLKKLGKSAFKTASKYGKTASDYLLGVQEMYLAGFNNADQMSELSILAQVSGGMDSATANDYLIASNAAYDLKGSVEDLKRVLDGQNYISNNAAVSMLDMAQATSEAASSASQYGVEIDELSSLIAVATSITRESGAETGTALKELFANLQDSTNKPIRDALEAVNISMTEMANGSEQLKNPIQLLKELSKAFASLEEGDVRRANILSEIGGKDHENTLSAILSDWSSFEKMLNLYSQGMGSAAKEAEKSSQNWEGSMNRLSNTWTSTVNNIAKSDAIIAGINMLNKFISLIETITSKLNSFEAIGLGAFALLNKGKSNTILPFVGVSPRSKF